MGGGLWFRAGMTGGTRPGREEGLRGVQGRSAAQQSQGCSVTSIWGKVGAGPRHLPVSSPTHRPRLLWPSPKICEHRPLLPPLFPAAPTGSGAGRQAPGARRESQRGRRGGGAAGGGAESRRLPEPYSRPQARERSVYRGSCARKAAGSTY